LNLPRTFAVLYLFLVKRDEDCEVVGLSVSGDNGSIISIGANELTVFSKAQSDCKKKTIHFAGAQRNLIPVSN
jgi:hypothetical protein